MVSQRGKCCLTAVLDGLWVQSKVGLCRGSKERCLWVVSWGKWGFAEGTRMGSGHNGGVFKGGIQLVQALKTTCMTTA